MNGQALTVGELAAKVPPGTQITVNGRLILVEDAVWHVHEKKVDFIYEIEEDEL